MKKRFYLAFCLLAFLSLCEKTANAQAGGVSINSSGNNPHPSAGLDVSFDDKGMLIPRMTTTDRNAIVNPAVGLSIFNTTTNCFNHWTGTSWKQLCGDCDFNTPVAGNSGPVCEGSALNLTATTIIGATYQWSGPNAFSSTLQNPSIPGAITSASGTYSVTATLNGCTTQPQNTVATVNPTPVTPVASNDSPVCSGNQLHLSANTINGATYTWSGPDSYSATGQNPDIFSTQMSNAGIYNVTATVNGCVSAAGSTTAVINSTPSSSFTPVTAVATISQLFAPAVSGAVYSWTFTSGSPANSADETPSVTWSTAGSYNVSLSVTANGCSSSTTNQVTVSTPIIQTFSYSGGEQTFTVPGGVTSLIVQCWGAEGGNSGAQAGKGGYASGTLSVSPGNTLYLYVGGQGTTVGNSSIGGGGFNGGGNANGSSGGGGGASDVRFGGNSLGNRMIVAGGGGGGGYSGSGGGAGGGLTGSDGANGTAGTPGGGGQGGSQSSGGNGGSPGSGGAGNIGQGGQGGNVAGIGYSGGGGGGYYGGGGGGGEISWGNGGGGSGGGGSSYIGGVTNGSTTSNVWSGNGQIKIIYF